MGAADKPRALEPSGAVQQPVVTTAADLPIQPALPVATGRAPVRGLTSQADGSTKRKTNAIWQLRTGYRLFNAGDTEAAIALMCFDVDWPNLIDGGREHGRDAVRLYWSRIFSLMRPRFEIKDFRLGLGRVWVYLHQTIGDTRGHPIAHQHLWHVYMFRDGLIARMDVRGGA